MIPQQQEFKFEEPKSIDHLVVQWSGSYKRDFLFFNEGLVPMNNKEVEPQDLIPLRYKYMTDAIKQMKSEAWSCDCTWFFMLADEGIYLMNVYNEHFWLCTKHTYKFIELFIKAPSEFKTRKK